MGRRLALCVGVNDYPGTGSDLAGCVNDALDWSAALDVRGYVVTELLDAQASKAAVLGILTAWAKLLRRGDRAVFTFSGHGTWLPDANGDEADGRDEALCLADFRTGGLLLDDELAGVYAAMRSGVRFTVVSDSCHSGTASRFAAAAVPATGPVGFPFGGPRYLPPDRFLTGSRLAAAAVVEHRPARGASRPGTVLLSGCADAELSYDAWFAGRPNGAMTRAALDALAPVGQRQTVAAWHKALDARVDKARHPQNPQLTASLWQRRSQPFA